MKYSFLSKLLLLLVISFSSYGIFFDVYAVDRKEAFAIVWEDNSKRDAALLCLQECVSDSSKVLNVTKQFNWTWSRA